MHVHSNRRLGAAVFACLCALGSGRAFADNVVADDEIVQGSLCVGFDCVVNENFGFDTVRLKENNTRIDFMDTSSTAGFPTEDWGIVINDSVSGGANYFMIQDRGADGTSADSVFRIDAGPAGGVAIGFGATMSGAMTFSVGAAGSERRITNVAAAVSGTDAVNLDQMNAAIAAASLGGVDQTYVDNGDASTLDSANAHADGGDASTLGSASAHANAGDASTLASANAHADAGDAATLASANAHADAGDTATLATARTYTDTRATATLHSANAYTDQRVDALSSQFSTLQTDVWSRLDRTDRRIDRNGAMNTAMAQMTANAAGGRSDRGRVAVGLGEQNGESALSIGYGRMVGDRASLTFGAAISGSESSAGIGMGFDL